MGTDMNNATSIEMHKQLIVESDNQILISRILDGTDRLIGRLSRRSRPGSYVYTAFVISILALMLDLIISLILGEFQRGVRATFFVYEVLITVVIFLTLVSQKLYFDYFFRLLNDKIIKQIPAVDDLNDLRQWQAELCNTRKTVVIAGIIAVLGVSYFLLPIALISRFEFSGYGALTLGLVMFFLGGNALYYLVYVLLFSLRIGRYKLTLYELNPSSSEIIDDISGLISTYAYLISVFMAVVTAVLVILDWVSLPIILPTMVSTWLLILLVYGANHYSLARAIRSAKRQTLNSLQIRIEDLHIHGDLSEKDVTDSLNRMIDYHDRIRATPNSAINLRAGLNFINSLLLPVLAFLLSNLQELIAFVLR